jgi:hypothetical protein
MDLWRERDSHWKEKSLLAAKADPTMPATMPELRK